MKHTMLKKMTALLMVSMAMTSIVCLPAQATTTSEAQQVTVTKKIVVKTNAIPISIVSSDKSEVEFNVTPVVRETDGVTAYIVANLDETKNKSVEVSVPKDKSVNITVMTDTGNIDYKASDANTVILKSNNGNITVNGQATGQIRAVAPKGTVTVSENQATTSKIFTFDKNTNAARRQKAQAAKQAKK